MAKSMEPRARLEQHVHLILHHVSFSYEGGYWNNKVHRMCPHMEEELKGEKVQKLLMKNLLTSPPQSLNLIIQPYPTQFDPVPISLRPIIILPSIFFPVLQTATFQKASPPKFCPYCFSHVSHHNPLHSTFPFIFMYI